MLDLSGIPVKAFADRYQSEPISLCKPVTNPMPPSTVSVVVDWSQQPLTIGVPGSGAGVRVNFDVGSAAPAVILDRVQSVYIDNTQSSLSIYILFPDTGFKAICKPFSEKLFPVLSNGLEAIIYGINIGFVTPATPNAKTLVLFSNVLVPPINDSENALTPTQNVMLASNPIITPAGENIDSSGYMWTPAGDTFVKRRLALKRFCWSSDIFNVAGMAGKWLYIRKIRLTVFNAVSWFAPTVQRCRIEIVRSQDGLVIYDSSFTAIPDDTFATAAKQEILELNGTVTDTFLKIPAQDNSNPPNPIEYAIRNTDRLLAGECECLFGFTRSDQ
jgi:hypothetical protein